MAYTPTVFGTAATWQVRADRAGGRAIIDTRVGGACDDHRDASNAHRAGSEHGIGGQVQDCAFRRLCPQRGREGEGALRAVGREGQLYRRVQLLRSIHAQRDSAG